MNQLTIQRRPKHGQTYANPLQKCVDIYVELKTYLICRQNYANEPRCYANRPVFPWHPSQPPIRHLPSTGSCSQPRQLARKYANERPDMQMSI